MCGVDAFELSLRSTDQRVSPLYIELVLQNAAKRSLEIE